MHGSREGEKLDFCSEIHSLILRYLNLPDLLNVSQTNRFYKNLTFSSFHYRWRLQALGMEGKVPEKPSDYRDIIIQNARRFQREIAFFQEKAPNIIPLLNTVMPDEFSSKVNALAHQVQRFFIDGNEFNLEGIDAELKSINQAILEAQLQGAVGPHLKLMYVTRLPTESIVTHQEKFKVIVNLDLKDNLLETLPGAISICAKLRSLNLYGNPITNLPETLSECPIRFFYLSGGKMPVVPDCIFRLNKLQWLSLHQMGIQQIPDTIQNLKHLTWLNLMENDLRYLPGGLLTLGNLQEIHVSQNQLSIQQPFGIWDFLAQRGHTAQNELMMQQRAGFESLSQDRSLFARAYLPMSSHQPAVTVDDGSDEALNQIERQLAALNLEGLQKQTI